MIREEKTSRQMNALIAAVLDEYKYIEENSTPEDYERQGFWERYAFLRETLDTLWKTQKEGNKTILNMMRNPKGIEIVPDRRKPPEMDAAAARKHFESVMHALKRE